MAVAVKNPPAGGGDAGDSGSISRSGTSPREGSGNSFWYSCLEIPQTEEPDGLQFMKSPRVKTEHQISNQQGLSA